MDIPEPFALYILCTPVGLARVARVKKTIVSDSSDSSDDVPQREDELAALVRECLMKGKVPELPEKFRGNEQFRELLAYIAEMQRGLSSLSRGDLSEPVSLKGYTGGMLKSLQSNLRHLLWKASSVAKGDFSQQIDFMGDVESAFNSMVFQLRESRDRIFAVSEELRQEVAIRKKIEAQLLLEKERLHRLAVSDVLADIFNRRHFFDLAIREVEHMLRSGRSACVAMMDLDNFKGINDSFGHRQGDKELCLLAETIKNNTRPFDIPARYGGDEFIIFLAETEKSDAYRVMERIREKISEANEGRSEAEPRISISAGVAELVPSGDDASALLEDAIGRADAALYQSKLRGRNRVSIDGE